MTICQSVRSAIALALLLNVGCGDQHDVAEVDGRVLIQGKPGHKIHIEFIPDIETKTTGPVSTADTDSEGSFRLEMRAADGTVTTGAVAGWHRVVLSDMQLAESETGQGIPIRLPLDVTMVGSTPLIQEVKPGKQTIEIRVPQ